jgi:hypothetical protein
MVFLHFAIAAVAAPPAPPPAPPAPVIEIVGQTQQGAIHLQWPGREGDKLFVDGWEWGVLPLDTELAEGEHEFRVEGEKGPRATVTVMVRVVPGQTTVLDLSVPPTPPVPAVPAVTAPAPAPAGAPPAPTTAPAPK